MIASVIELDDGRSICAINDYANDSTYWLACRLEAEPDGSGYRLADQLADIPVYGTSLALLLNAALDSGGDIAHLETGTLADLL